MGEPRLNIVNHDQDEHHEIRELRNDLHAFREETRMWQAVILGIVAGLGAIIGAMAMACK